MEVCYDNGHFSIYIFVNIVEELQQVRRKKSEEVMEQEHNEQEEEYVHEE